MCLICVDLQKDKMTWKEARQNLREMYTEMDKDHIFELLQLIWEKQDIDLDSLKIKEISPEQSQLEFKFTKEYEDIIELWKKYGGD